MTLVRYNPWSEINSLQRQLNRLFDDALTPANWDDFGNLAKIPAAELTETDDALHLKLEVPGMKAKDLDIQVMADRVAIAGERKSETKTEENGKTRSEFRYGKFALSNSPTSTDSKHKRYRRIQKRYTQFDSTQV